MRKLKPKKDFVTLSVRIEELELLKANEVAEHRGWSTAAVIRTALNLYLNDSVIPMHYMIKDRLPEYSIRRRNV